MSLARLVGSCLTAFDICASKSAGTMNQYFCFHDLALSHYSLFLALSLLSSATDSKSGWAGLWEDSMLMGFMPLKASVSTETSLATPTLYRLTHEVSKV